MFKHANGSVEFIREMFLDLTGNDLEVILAQKDATIYFTKMHIADLKSVIAAEIEGINKGSNPNEEIPK